MEVTQGNDTISGGACSDLIDGGASNDSIEGGTSSDRILTDTGTGDDYADGGDDADTFVVGMVSAMTPSTVVKMARTVTRQTSAR